MRNFMEILNEAYQEKEEVVAEEDTRMFVDRFGNTNNSPQDHSVVEIDTDGNEFCVMWEEYTPSSLRAVMVLAESREEADIYRINGLPMVSRSQFITALYSLLKG